MRGGGGGGRWCGVETHSCGKVLDGDEEGGCIGLVHVAREGLVGSILVRPGWPAGWLDEYLDEPLRAVIGPAFIRAQCQLELCQYHCSCMQDEQ